MEDDIVCQDVMVDLETLGTQPGAAVVAIGAVFFNRDKSYVGPRYYTTIDIKSITAYGFGVDGATVEWWLGRSQEAREALLKDPQKLIPALMEFAHFVTDDIDGGVEEDVRVWGNGAAFDNVLLRAVYERLDLNPPWRWWNDRCYRTLKKERDPASELAPKREGVHHHALDDALFQTYHLLNMDAGYRRYDQLSAGGEAQLELMVGDEDDGNPE